MKRTYQSKWLAGIIAACALVMVSSAGYCGEAKASLTKLEGAVLTRDSDTADWKPAAEGMKLGAGAAVRCQAGASAFLNWSGNTVKVHPLSDVRVTSLMDDPDTGVQQSELQLMKGKTFARTKKLTGKGSSFTINTPSAIAGVRGTDFGVELSEAQTTSVAVMSDEVVVEAGGVEITVTESMLTMVDLGAPPMEPAPIPADMMQDLQADVQEVGEVETAVSEASAQEETEEKAEEETEEEEEAAAEEEPAEEEAAAEETAAVEETAAGEEAGDMTMEDVSAIVEDTTSESLDTNLNQNIAEQGETLFLDCCQPR